MKRSCNHDTQVRGEWGWRAIMHFLGSGLCMTSAFSLITARQPISILSADGQSAETRDFTVAFQFGGFVLFAAAVGLCWLGWRATSRRAVGQVLLGNPAYLKKGRAACAINIFLIGISLWTGYEEEAIQSRFVTLGYFGIACGMWLFAVLVPAVARAPILPKARFTRFSLDWAADPLQTLLTTTLSIGGMAIGSLVRTIAGGPSLNASAIFGSMFAGLLIGYVTVLRLFRHRIVTADETV